MAITIRDKNRNIIFTGDISELSEKGDTNISCAYDARDTVREDLRAYHVDGRDHRSADIFFAEGEALEYIRQNFSGIPMHLTAEEMLWRGDMALFLTRHI